MDSSIKKKLCTAVIRGLVKIYKRFKGNTKQSVYSNKTKQESEQKKSIDKHDGTLNVSVNRKKNWGK